MFIACGGPRNGAPAERNVLVMNRWRYMSLLRSDDGFLRVGPINMLLLRSKDRRVKYVIAVLTVLLISSS